MAGSLSVAVRRAVADGLEELFAGLPAFNSTAAEAEVGVTYAYDFTDARAAQCIYTGRSRADTPPAALRAGRNRRQETGRFDLNILVQVVADDFEAADERVDEISVQVEEWVADRKSGEGLDLTGLNSLRAASWEGDYYPLDSGAASIRTYSIEWVANLL